MEADRGILFALEHRGKGTGVAVFNIIKIHLKTGFLN